MLFQSTLPREERQTLVKYVSSIIVFNPRSHERSDCKILVSSYLCTYFQSTLPREERLIVHFADPISGFFSIHAPTRGATETVDVWNMMLEFSIHAPTRGATLCDQRHGKQFGFSIHAPTRGATVYCLRDIIFIKLFNPRSHERSDLLLALIVIMLILFSIHAPTRGATK